MRESSLNVYSKTVDLPKNAIRPCLFIITKSFLLLCDNNIDDEVDRFHYTVHINNRELEFTYVCGAPTYITKNGYLMFNRENKKIIFSSEDITSYRKINYDYYCINGYLLFCRQNKK